MFIDCTHVGLFPRVISQAPDLCPFAIGAIRMFLIALRVHPIVSDMILGLANASITFCFLRRHLCTRAPSQPRIVGPPYNQPTSIRLTSDTQSPLS